MIISKSKDYKTFAYYSEQNLKKYYGVRDQIGGYITFWFFVICIIMVLIGGVEYLLSSWMVKSKKIQ